MITQLAQQIPVTVTEGPPGVHIGNGRGYCIAWERHSMDWHLLWIVVLDESGQVIVAPNKFIRVDPNWTAGRS
jgi:hypothetical protein